jgi:hypothetical protein
MQAVFPDGYCGWCSGAAFGRRSGPRFTNKNVSEITMNANAI